MQAMFLRFSNGSVLDLLLIGQTLGSDADAALLT